MCAHAHASDRSDICSGLYLSKQEVNMATATRTSSLPVPKFSPGEIVLCYEPDHNKAKVLYESKVGMLHEIEIWDDNYKQRCISA